MDNASVSRSDVIVRKSALCYAQVLAILIVIVACVINLSIGTETTELWASLLSGSLGYLLPSPKIRKKYGALLPNSTQQQLDEILPGQQDQSFRHPSSNADIFDGGMGSSSDGNQLPPVLVHSVSVPVSVNSVVE